MKIEKCKLARGADAGVFGGTEDLYDDSPWARKELESLATQTAERVGWEAEQDDAAETR